MNEQFFYLYTVLFFQICSKFYKGTQKHNYIFFIQIIHFLFML